MTSNCIINIIIGYYFSCGLINATTLPFKMSSSASSSLDCPSTIAMESNKNLLKALTMETLEELHCHHGVLYRDGGRPTLITSNYGSQEGSDWDDDIICHESNIVGIRSMDINYGSHINSIQVTYLLGNGSLREAPRHGGNGSSSSSIILSENERIVRVEGSTDGTVINHLVFISNDSNGTEKAYGPYGTPGQVHFNVVGYILGFRGKANDADVTSLAVYYLRPLVKSTETFGGTGRTYPFDDSVDAIIPPVVGIKNIMINYGSLIDSIQCTYILLGGGLLLGQLHGGVGGTNTTVMFKEMEMLQQVTAGSYYAYLGQLTLHTSFWGEITRHGQYGERQQASFNFYGIILGFHGYEEYYSAIQRRVISRIGVYTV